MKVILISDTHGLHAGLVLPAGDTLVHAGDLTSRGSMSEVRAALQWFANVGDFRHRVLIAGNHDFLFEKDPETAWALMPDNVTYLNDSGETLDGVKFWGSPVTPWFHDWAFNRRGAEIKPHWDLIPGDTDVLITHGPPAGILDTVYPRDEHVGCPELLWAVRRVQPKLHVFGHIHEGYGSHIGGAVTSVNASICDRNYKPLNKPVEMIL